MANYLNLSEFAKASSKLKKFPAVKATRYTLPAAPSITKHVKTVGTGAARLGGAIGAAAYGAYRIRKAAKAANKEIESIHSPARNKAHNEMLKTIRASGVRKRAKAAKKLRYKLKEFGISKHLNPVNYIPGGQGSKNFDHRKWR